MNDAATLLPGRVEELVVAHADETTCLPGGVQDLGGLRRVDRERLLQVDVRPLPQGLERDRAVRLGRGRDVQHVGPGGGQHVAQVIEHLRHPESRRRLTRQVEVPVADSHDLRLGDLADLLQVGVGDLAAPDEANSKLNRLHDTPTPTRRVASNSR
jgi:hypothetical protein